MSRISDIARLLYVDPNRRAEFIRLMQEQGVVKDFESQIYRKDGSVIWISENARAVRNADGKIQYYEGMVEDITARKEAEEKLRFSETRFRSVWQNSNDGMRLTDEQGIVAGRQPLLLPHRRPARRRIGGAPLHRRLRRKRGFGRMMRTYQQRFAERRIDTPTGAPRHLPLRQDGGLRAVQLLHRNGRGPVAAAERVPGHHHAQAGRGTRAPHQRRTGPQPGGTAEEKRNHGGRPENGAGNPTGHAAAAISRLSRWARRRSRACCNSATAIIPPARSAAISSTCCRCRHTRPDCSSAMSWATACAPPWSRP